MVGICHMTARCLLTVTNIINKLVLPRDEKIKVHAMFVSNSKSETNLFRLLSNQQLNFNVKETSGQLQEPRCCCCSSSCSCWRPAGHPPPLPNPLREPLPAVGRTGPSRAADRTRVLQPRAAGSSGGNQPCSPPRPDRASGPQRAHRAAGGGNSPRSSMSLLGQLRFGSGSLCPGSSSSQNFSTPTRPRRRCCPDVGPRGS